MNPNNVLSLLPGPVCIAPQVQKAFMASCISHRSSACLSMVAQIQSDLCRLTGARNAQIILGSGTLANEIVAAQLGLLKTSGLILANGEFGERLITNARRAQLQFQSITQAWGAPFDFDEVEQHISKLPPKGWVWVVHHETSTGMLNPLERLKTLCKQHDVYLCLDCISSVGAMPVNLEGVYLATTVSGKGIGSYPGLSIVFHHDLPTSQPEYLPGYLDLGNWAANASIPYTHSTNLLNALNQAMQLVTPQRMEEIRLNMLWLRAALAQCGLTLLVPVFEASSAVVSIVPKEPNFANWLGHELEAQGYWLSFKSAYLKERNWIQISLLGNPAKGDLKKLMQAIRTMIQKNEATSRGFLRNGFLQTDDFKCHMR